jgi:hypothetical protein
MLGRLVTVTCSARPIAIAGTNRCRRSLIAFRLRMNIRFARSASGMSCSPSRRTRSSTERLRARHTRPARIPGRRPYRSSRPHVDDVPIDRTLRQREALYDFGPSVWQDYQRDELPRRPDPAAAAKSGILPIRLTQHAPPSGRAGDGVGRCRRGSRPPSCRRASESADYGEHNIMRTFRCSSTF